MRQAEVLRRVFPGLDVQGGNYPPPFWKQSVGTLLTYTQYALMAWLFLGSTLFGMLGIQEPAVLTRLRANRMALLGGYFGMSFLSTQLLSTGAFEVLLNGRTIFSKLATGRPPSVQDVATALVQAGLVADPAAATAYGLVLGGGSGRTVPVPVGQSAGADFATGEGTI